MMAYSDKIIVSVKNKIYSYVSVDSTCTYGNTHRYAHKYMIYIHISHICHQTYECFILQIMRLLHQVIKKHQYSWSQRSGLLYTHCGSLFPCFYILSSFPIVQSLVFVRRCIFNSEFCLRVKWEDSVDILETEQKKCSQEFFFKELLTQFYYYNTRSEATMQTEQKGCLIDLSTFLFS